MREIIAYMFGPVGLLLAKGIGVYWTVAYLGVLGWLCAIATRLWTQSKGRAA
jgi:hypothetical protein